MQDSSQHRCWRMSPAGHWLDTSPCPPSHSGSLVDVTISCVGMRGAEKRSLRAPSRPLRPWSVCPGRSHCHCPVVQSDPHAKRRSHKSASVEPGAKPSSLLPGDGLRNARDARAQTPARAANPAPRETSPLRAGRSPGPGRCDTIPRVGLYIPLAAELNPTSADETAHQSPVCPLAQRSVP